MGWFTIILSSLILLGCSGSGTNEALQFKSALPVEEEVTFEILKDQILEPFCIRCHVWASTKDQLASKIDGNNPSSSPLYIKTKDGSMPEGGPVLNETQLAMIEKYIRSQPNKPSDPILEPTYLSLNFHLFQKFCIRCHEGDRPRAGVLLNSYEEVVRHSTNSLLQIETNQMPPRAPFPNAELVDTLRNWIASGHPEN